MAKLVEDMYNELAVITGFPTYLNETNTPDTTKFLLQALSHALQNTIDNLYTTNNVLERTDTLYTMPKQSKYGIEGMVKNLQIKDDVSGRYIRLPYLDNFNKDEEDANVQVDKPKGYVIKKGYLRLVPIPDKEYELKVTLSTNNLVWANNDVSKISITNIDDAVMASEEFCNIVVLKAATIVFMRCQNANAKIYAEIGNNRLRNLIERDAGSIEASRVWDRSAGHYNPDKGLLG